MCSVVQQWNRGEVSCAEVAAAPSMIEPNAAQLGQAEKWLIQYMHVKY